MSGQWVFIEPNDVWMFRDNKPFTAQQNFVARGQFPPTPMTMQGAIRSFYLENALPREGRTWSDYKNGHVSDDIIQKVGLPKLNGQPATLGNLRLTGPFVAKINDKGDIERLIKAPLDLLKTESDKYRLLSPGQTSFETEPPFDNWRPLVGGGEGFKEADGWLTEAQFQRYLDGKDSISNLGPLTKEDALFSIEERVGLALDYRRRAHQESMFHRTQFTRLCEDVGLLVHVNLDIFEQASGFINIGGESRSGRYRIVPAPQALSQHKSGRIRIILLTPAYFTNGWQPQNSDWSPWVGNGKLVSVVIGKPHPISGWDVAHNRPKPLRHYVPTGSVFFFEDAQFTGIPFTESPVDSPDQGAMGFGTFAIGIW